MSTTINPPVVSIVSDREQITLEDNTLQITYSVLDSFTAYFLPDTPEELTVDNFLAYRDAHPDLVYIIQSDGTYGYVGYPERTCNFYIYAENTSGAVLDKVTVTLLTESNNRIPIKIAKDAVTTVRRRFTGLPVLEPVTPPIEESPFENVVALTFSFDNTIVRNETVEAGITKYFSFTPVVTFEYYLHAIGQIDTYATLYDASGTEITNNDDDVGTNFGIRINLIANTKYYLAVRGYNQTTSGNYELNIEPL